MADPQGQFEDRKGHFDTHQVFVPLRQRVCWQIFGVSFTQLSRLLSVCVLPGHLAVSFVDSWAIEPVAFCFLDPFGRAGNFV